MSSTTAFSAANNEVVPPTTPRPPVAKANKKNVFSHGNFPSVGSTLGNFFCLGRLGKGTFCSIHKCCALDYWKQRDPRSSRIVAAKVELSNFTNSGVLEGEACMLQHLDRSLPPKTVPTYFGHYVADKASAIVMEFLGGDDMHQLREKMGSRRISVEDAVYLTADVLLPLLQSMHEAGIVHRDVKPSNCVRRKGKEFSMVDFGLSKSIIVPKESPHADKTCAFSDSHSLRQERETADFRGTSMYASLRVHQLKDYSWRDDMWSVLYVFCDLVSGGLPWMSYAANRDRDMCQKLKEKIHGTPDHTEQMLMGEEYHLAKFKRDMMQKEKRPELPNLPEPLALSKNAEKVNLLRQAFSHVASLGFADTPDYKFLRTCLLGFLDGPRPPDDIPPMEWKDRVSHSNSRKRKRWDDDAPTWLMEDIKDPLEEEGSELWQEADSQVEPVGDAYTNASDISKLPVEFQFRIAQMDYNSHHTKQIPKHVALNDWMQCVLPLLYGKWDSSKFEKGNHRTNTDGFRRETYLKVLEKCLKCASAFELFRDVSCYYDTSTTPGKKRKISSKLGGMTSVSRALFGLKMAKSKELKKRFAPPPTLSFSQG